MRAAWRAGILLLACWLVGSTPLQAAEELSDTLILISIDGARHDYLQQHDAPTLSRLARQGLRVEHLKPVFPTKTFSNHYSLVTGLHPQHHGIVDNTMYDPQTGDSFSLGDWEAVQDPAWWGGEPIWVTAEKQGMVSATFFFPGSEAPIQGIRPSYWLPYDESTSNRERVDTVLTWLSKPREQRPQIITLYFSDVDTAGHRYGPESRQVREALGEVDAEVSYLVSELGARGWLDQVNLVISSDHGMSAVDLHQHIVIDEAFDTSLAKRVLYSRELVSIFPEEGAGADIVRQLRDKLPPQASVYTRETMPRRFHFTQHHRIAPIIVLADNGWALLRRSWLERMQADGSIDQIRGGHGYDNAEQDMQGLLIAHGPAFRQQSRIHEVSMVDIYHVMAAVLQLTPASNDGDPAVIPLFLK